MIGSVLGEHGPAAERALIHVIDERPGQLRFLLDEERRRHIAAPRIHAERVAIAAEDLIAPIIEPGFVRLATQDVDVLLPYEVLRRVEWIRIVARGGSAERCFRLVPELTETAIRRT